MKIMKGEALMSQNQNPIQKRTRKPRKVPFYLNAPVVLGMTLITLIVLIVDTLTKGTAIRLFGMHYSSWTDPMMYVRMFTHIFTHADLEHYTGNFMLILLIGPMVEDKYGSKNLLEMIIITSLVTGLIDVIFFRDVMFIGASGIVFMLILLASFTDIKNGKLPITVLLISVLYIGNEVVNGIIANDNVSQISHIVGGFCGAFLGFAFHHNKGSSAGGSRKTMDL